MLAFNLIGHLSSGEGGATRLNLFNSPQLHIVILGVVNLIECDQYRNE